MGDQPLTRRRLRKLLQETYFDNIDDANARAAVRALHEDVEWVHTQVWVHDGHDRSETDTLHGRGDVLDFLASRLDSMQELGLKHTVLEVLVDGSKGAFRARVEGPGNRSIPFLGWVEVRDDRISHYLVAPERPAE